ncbi:MAG: glycosyltransferase family 4 protein [Patescibacteria group bacterium]|jgi:glycosyltransferase involved in cell wall biosynthesis
MIIAFVSDAIYPYNKGGKEKRLYEISRRLAVYGHKVVIFTMKWWSGPDEITENGVTLKSVGKSVNLYTNERRRSLSEAFLFGIKVFLPVLRFKYDLLIVDHIPYFQLFSLKIVSLLKRKKLLADWHEVWGKKNWQEYLGKLKGLFAYYIEYWSTKMPNVIFSISDFTTRRLKNEFGVSPNKINTVSCGIDLAQISLANKKTEYTSDCIFAGRLLNHKKVDVLIKSIDIIKNKYKSDIKCIIIGDGPEKKYLVQQADESGLKENILFKGFLADHNEVYSYFKSSKLFVFPSIREGFGLVVPEANACGLPVIAVRSDFSASIDLIHDNQNGFLLNLSENEIADKIIEIFKDQKKLTAFSENSIKFSQNFSWDLIVKKMENIYKQIYSS